MLHSKGDTTGPCGVPFFSHSTIKCSSPSLSVLVAAFLFFQFFSSSLAFSSLPYFLYSSLILRHVSSLQNFGSLPLFLIANHDDALIGT